MGQGKTTNDLQVESYDNRTGPNEDGVGFGYVYFNDGTRVCWQNPVERGEDVWFNGQQHWGPVTDKHIKVAREYLREEGLLTG